MTSDDAAARWHQDNIDKLDHDYSSCWCCCITCEHTNPHFDAATAAVRELRSLRTTDPPT